MLAVNLQVGFDHPMMAVGALALEQERVRPRAPLRALVQVALRAANRLVNERDAAGQADAPGPGVKFEELAVRQANYPYRLRLSCGRFHGNSAIREIRMPDRGGKVFLYFSSFTFKNGPKGATLARTIRRMGPCTQS